VKRAWRVVFVEEEVWMGGVEFSTLNLATRVNRSRFAPLVVCPAEGDLPRHCRERGVPLAIVPRPRLFSTGIRIGQRIITNPATLVFDAFASLLAAIRLAYFLRSRADLVVTKGMDAHFYGGLAARLVRLPCIWHVQDWVNEQRGFGLYPTILSWGARNFAQRIIVDGEAILKQLDPDARQRALVIYNGVDTNEFSPHVDGSSVRMEFDIPSDVPLIGTVARLVAWKGHHVFLEAIATLADDFPEARFLIVGAPVFDTEEYACKLRAQTERLGLADRVRFAGFRWDLPQGLAALDIFVHPALEKDTSPLAVVSAMASGKAIVASAVEGVREIIEHEQEGLLVLPGDVEALAQAIRCLLAEPDLRQRLGQGARAKAMQELSVAQFVQRCEAIFEAVLAERS
jgi:glycosyltransferase involved in cell wall biosynthesis